MGRYDSTVLGKYIAVSVLIGGLAPLAWKLVQTVAMAFGTFGLMVVLLVQLVLFYLSTLPWLLIDPPFVFKHWQYFCLLNCVIVGIVLGLRSSSRLGQDIGVIDARRGSSNPY